MAGGICAAMAGALQMPGNAGISSSSQQPLRNLGDNRFNTVFNSVIQVFNSLFIRCVMHGNLMYFDRHLSSE